MSRSLQKSSAHLAGQRRAIAAHAVAAALAGLVPLPYVDEQLPALVKRALIRRLAAARHVDLDEDAIRELAEGRVPPPGLRSLLGLGPFVRSLGRSLRTAFLAYSVYRRADAASHTFALGTLFDHHCARHHVGVGLDVAEARALRGRIERAIGKAGGTLGGYVFRRGLWAALRATVRAPLELALALTAGQLRRLRGRKDEVEAEELVEATLDREVADERSFLGRAARAVDRQLGTLGQGWIDGLVQAFEEEET